MPKKSLAETHPEVAKQWHPTLNGDLTPSNFSSGSGKKVWWKCPKGDDHEWESRINHRTDGSGCPICSGRKVVESNCIATSHILNLAKQWHPTLNGDLTHMMLSVDTVKKVWWKCDKGDDHEWEASINQRTNSGSGCSICSGRKSIKSNSLATNTSIT